MKYFIICLIVIGFVGSVFAEESEWKTFDIVGKYIHSDPAIPDQTFKVQYRITNATLISIAGDQTNVIAIANTTENGLLEVKFPRNFPYTNEKWEGEIFIIINGYGPNAYYLPETTSMMDHVRPKIINDINRPPPHPETFSNVTDCHYIFEIPFYTFAKIEIVYGSNGLITRPYHGDDISDDCLGETLSETKRKPFYYVASPLKQEQLGVRPGQIVCPPDKTLVWKTNSGKPTCVKPESVSKLVSRSWANQELVKSTTEPSKEYELTGRSYLIESMIDGRIHHYEKRQFATEYSEKYLDGQIFVHHYFQNVANNYFLGDKIVFGYHSWGNDYLGDCVDRKMIIKDFDGKVMHEQKFDRFCPEDTQENSWYQKITINQFMCTNVGLYTIHIVDTKDNTTSEPLEAFSCVA